MTARRPDLIVPIRDRRARKRYLTLKNFRNALVVGGVVFAAITIRSELRDTTGRNYGKLMSRITEQPVEQQPVDVVRETAPEVDDHASADPMLVAPIAREQWLEGSVHGIEPAPPQAVVAGEGRESEVAIVGDASGVAVVKKERRRPLLSGGFGK